MTEPWTVIGGVVTAAVAGGFGYLGTIRGRRVQDQVAVIDQVREWADQLQESEENCRREMHLLRGELEQVRQELNNLRAEVRKNEENSHE